MLKQIYNSKALCWINDNNIKEKEMMNRTFKRSLLTSAIFAGFSFTQIGYAADENNAETIENEVERIAVTGSRIGKPELTQATPITTISQEEISRFGNTDIASVLAELPAVGATDTIVGNNGSNADAGLSSADLRRLGAVRTLTLVNGKRHVAGSPGSAQVDLSTIPASLIKRIDILTGGASAIYGSDAVTGVINVVLKDDFEGFEFDVSTSNSLQGVDNKQHAFTLLTGADISDGKGNVTFFANYDRTKEVMAPQIRQYDNWGTIVNPENTGEEDGIPDRLRVPRVYSEFISSNGVVNPFGGGERWTFDNNGNPVLQTERDGSNSFAFGNFSNDCEYCFKPEDYENYIPEAKRITVGSMFNYELHENIEFYSDFKYTNSQIKQQFQPSFRFGNVNVNVADNAFLNEDLRQSLLDAGQTNVRFAKFFDELGNRSADNDRDLFRIVGGFRGDFTLSETPFNYELFYVYGETRNTRKTLNSLVPDNFVAALDSVIDPETGEAACRSQVSSAQGEGYTDPASVNGGDCVAYNPFGLGQASEAAKDWISADVTRKDKISQEVIGATIATDSSEFFELLGGPIDLVVGWEYREETSETTTDEFTKAGFLTNAATPDAFGEYDVTEYFAEINLPLIKDIPGIHELTIDAAYRSGDYSHAGRANAWKVGLFYSPIPELSIRGTINEAVRAPNIGEAFDPLSPGFARVSDPCDADNINDDPDRAANCAALGIPSGFEANDNVSVDLLSGGNPELTPEESTSYTAGIVWQPEYISGFNFNVDYYDIEIKDAILFVAAQDIADNCVDATGGPDQQYCSQVTRDPVTNDISLVQSGYLNASAIYTRGIELNADYQMDLGSGELKLNLFANKLLELEFFEFQDRPDEINDEKGEVGDPELQLRLTATYTIDDLRLGWASRYIDRVATFDVSPNGGSPEDTSPGYIGSITTHDITADYAVSDNLFVRAGVRNFLDKTPPGYTSNAIYDLVGRRFYVGLTYKM